MKQYLKNIIVFSISINFIWEMLQMPFYKHMYWDVASSVFCFAASLGDAAMVLIIFAIVSLIEKSFCWILVLNNKDILSILIIGFLLSVLVEFFALEMNLWEYSNLMPRLPYLELGVVPILQMTFLPLSIFKLTAKNIIKKHEAIQ